jgi:hypothetical protein
MQRAAPRPWICAGLVVAWSCEVLANPYIAASCNNIPLTLNINIRMEVSSLDASWAKFEMHVLGFTSHF